MDHRLIRFAFAFGLLGAAPAAAETRPTPGGSIVIAMPEQPVVPVDPPLALRWADQMILIATADRLYDGGRPLLADGPPTFVSPLLARIRLRAGAHFQDGRPLGAADVAAVLQLRRRVLSPLAGASALPDGTLEIALAAPLAASDLQALLAMPQAGVPRTGPFVLLAADAREVRLEAYTAYSGGRPWLDRVTLRTYKSRNDATNALELGTAQVSLVGGGRRRATEALAAPEQSVVTYLGVSRTAPPWARDALAALDRDAIRMFAAREPAVTLGPPPNPRVRAALAPAARGHVLTLIIDGSRFQDAAVAQKVQAQLARVGAEVRIETLPAAELERRVEAGVEHDLYVGQCALPPVRADLAAAILRACGADALPLYRRSLRAHHVPELRGLRFDAGGRLRLEDAFVWRRAGVALGRP